MKNFQANHGQCDSIIFPQNIFFSRLKALAKLELCLADSRIHYFGCVLETVHIFNIELHVLKFLLVRGSNKGGVGLFLTSQKEKLFHVL